MTTNADIGGIDQVVRSTAVRSPHAAALIGAWGERTWGELDLAADRGAEALLDLLPSSSGRDGRTESHSAGAPASIGHRVVLALPTGPELAAALVAVSRAGMIAVPIDPERSDVPWVVGRVGAAVLVGGGERPGEGMVGQASAPPRGTAPKSGTVMVISPAEAASWWAPAGQQRTAAGNPGAAVTPGAAATPGADPRSGASERIALLARASRSHPPVMLSHRAILAAARAIAETEPMRLEPTDRVLQVLPLYHVVGLVTAFLPAAMAGAAVVVPEHSDPADRAEAALAAVRRHRVSVLPAEATLYRQLDRVAGFERSLATVRLMTSGSSPLDPADFAAIRTATGQAVREGYGISEAASAITSTLMLPQGRVGTVGQPYPGVQIRIENHLADRDVDGADDVERSPIDPVDTADPGGGLGPISVRGATLFSGYWPDGDGGPGPDGWFTTGDIGYLDDSGELHLVDRVDETIRVAGFTVYPREVEDALVTHPLIADAAVVGVPGRAGSAVVAALVAKPGTRPTAADVTDFLGNLLPPFKRPTDYLVIDVLPRTEVGRLDRAAVRARFAEARGIDLGQGPLSAVPGSGSAGDEDLF